MLHWILFYFTNSGQHGLQLIMPLFSQIHEEWSVDNLIKMSRLYFKQFCKERYGDAYIFGQWDIIDYFGSETKQLNCALSVDGAVDLIWPTVLKGFFFSSDSIIKLLYLILSPPLFSWWRLWWVLQVKPWSCSRPQSESYPADWLLEPAAVHLHFEGHTVLLLHLTHTQYYTQ